MVSDVRFVKVAFSQPFFSLNKLLIVYMNIIYYEFLVTWVRQVN